MAQLSPYLNFNGNCREAMTFYKECLGGELMLQTVGSTPMADRCPEGMKEQIMHSSLVTENYIIMGSDMMGPEGFIPGNTMGLSLDCRSEKEINELFTKLGEDGRVFDPLKEMFWGATFGCVADKYGVRWMFNYTYK